MMFPFSFWKSAAAPASSLLTGLSEWFPLGEASGNRVGSHAGITLTGSSGTPGSASGVGGVGLAAQFNGTTTWLTLASPPAALQMTATDFAVSGWYYIDIGGTSNYLGLIGQGSYEFLLYYDPTVNKARFLTAGGNVLCSTLSSGQSIWYFLYADYTAATGALRISLNNGSFDTGTGGGVSSSNAYLIGHVNSQVDKHRVAKVGIWKRKLTAGEITALYNAGAGATYPF